MKRRIASINSCVITAFAALTIAGSAHAGGYDDYFGSIWLTAAQFCPRDTIEADGRNLQINQYQALFALYGATYGGDGKTTFAVPDMRGRVPMGTGQSNDGRLVQRGSKAGQDNITLSTQNIPIHTHAANFARNSASPVSVNISVSSNTTENSNQPSSVNNYLSASSSGSAGANMWSSSQGSTPINLAGVGSSGGIIQGGTLAVSASGAIIPAVVSTISPQIGLRFCITSSEGVWPPKPN